MTDWDFLVKRVAVALHGGEFDCDNEKCEPRCMRLAGQIVHQLADLHPEDEVALLEAWGWTVEQHEADWLAIRRPSEVPDTAP